MKKLIIILVLTSLVSCHRKGELKSGEIRHIPFTQNEAVGTDSFIYIIDRETGVTLNKIKRK